MATSIKYNGDVFGDMKIPKGIVDEMVVEVNDLLELRKRGITSGGDLEFYYNRWTKIANRISTGEKMLQTAETESTNPAYVEQLFDLYRFMLWMIALYDVVIEEVTPRFGKQKFHEDFRQRLLNIL
mgnify:CR=1 FL=1